MKYFIIFFLIVSCNTSKEEKKEVIEIPKPEIVEKPMLNLEQANRLAQLPLHCMETEYPNKLGQTLGSDADLKSPKTLHPTFYGCFDWHSSVHGHWSLVRLLKTFPELENAESVKEKLLKSISKENILTEVKFFDDQNNKSFERTYGWAWLLKLAEELHTWNEPIARELETNLQPLTNLIIEKYIEFYQN